MQQLLQLPVLCWLIANLISCSRTLSHQFRCLLVQVHTGMIIKLIWILGIMCPLLSSDGQKELLSRRGLVQYKNDNFHASSPFTFLRWKFHSPFTQSSTMLQPIILFLHSNYLCFLSFNLINPSYRKVEHSPWENCLFSCSASPVHCKE